MRTLLIQLRLGLFYLLDSLVLLISRREDVALTLVVRLDALGDFALWLQTGADSVLKAARQPEPTRVVLAANAVWAQFARDLGCADEVISIDVPRFMRRPLYRWMMLARLRRLDARLVIQPRSAKVFLQEDEIVRTCGASRRIGVEGSYRNTPARLSRWAERFYTELVPVQAHAECHESIRNQLLAQWFDHGSPPDRWPALAKDDSHDAVTRFEQPYMTVAPGAGWTGRQWPIESLVGVIRSVHVARGLRCVVVGSSGDSRMAGRLVQALPDVVIDRTGQCSVKQTALIMASAELVIANESGPLHLAIWAGAPTIGLLGGGHFGWFAPYPAALKTLAPALFLHQSMPCFGCDWKCRFALQRDGAVKCVDDIETSRVVDAALQLLSLPAAVMQAQ